MIRPEGLRERDAPSGEGAAIDGRGRGSSRLGGALLGIPLFYKLLIANVAVVGVAVSATAWLLLARPPGDSPLSGGVAWVLAGGAVLLGAVAANGLILRIALSPLDTLERIARRVSAGETAPRVPTSPLADRRLERLIGTFNEMLDRTDEHQRRLRELAARALAAQEEERRRVSRELHDDTGQRLAAALLRIGLLRSRAGDRRVKEGLDGLRCDLVDAVEGLRTFARDLRPPALSELGLVPAIDAYLRSIRERAPFEVELLPPLREPALEPEAELAAYRIVQEAVSNAVRHAAPTRVRVTIEVSSGAVSLVVDDDGCGFRPEEVLGRREEGLGIFGMQERAGYVGGRLSVESAPGIGTRVSVTIPCGSGPCGSGPRGSGTGPVSLDEGRPPSRLDLRAPAGARS